MARMMFENLNAIVANTLTDSIKMIDISELYDSEDNFFQIERIEEFAETILGQGGVKDNLIVRPLETGGYEIISGHRRKTAVQMLIDRGENISHYLPCLVQNYDDEETKQLDLILMNISTRHISDSEMWQSYEILDRILKDKKSAGEKFGRVREKLSEYLGVSPAQVGKMQNVEKNAIEEVKKAIENGTMSISTANEIAKLDEVKQEQLISSNENLNEITNRDVKEFAKEKIDTNINFDEEIQKDEIEKEIKEEFKQYMTKVENVDFNGDTHKKEYEKVLNKMKSSDCYHKCVAYLLTIDDVCVNHIDRIFDFKYDEIQVNCFNEDWQTGTTRKTIQLAFNLWNSYNEDVSIDDVFNSSYMRFYFEAIKLRYPEYNK